MAKLGQYMLIRNSIALFLCFMSLSLTAQYTLQGNAVEIGGGCYQLTDALPGQIGAVWYNETINLEQPFVTKFNVSSRLNPTISDSHFVTNLHK